jgi:hypothetical protein
MSIYLKWQNTEPDTKERFIANLFSNLSLWYPLNIQGYYDLYNILEMYGSEFSSGSSQITQTLNDLFIENVRTGVINNRNVSKMYDNFGVMVGINKTPYQEYDQFNTNSLLNSYRQELKLLYLSYIESTTQDSLSRIGHAINCIGPVIIEPILNYPGWVLMDYSGSVLNVAYNQQSRQFYAMVYPPFGRYGSILPILKPVINTGSVISMSYSILGLNTILMDEYSLNAGVILYFFIPSGSINQINDTQNIIKTAVDNVLPAYIKPHIFYSYDFISWRPVQPASDIMVSGSNIFAISKHGWIYNANPTHVTGSIFITDVIEIP